MSNNQELEEQIEEVAGFEMGYGDYEEAYRLLAEFFKDQQLALINKIEELESMQDGLTTTQEEGWLVNRKLDRNRLRSELREALNKLKQEV